MPDAGRNPRAGGCPTSAELAAYVDGRLPPPQRADVAAHLADCDRCLELVAEVDRTVEALEGAALAADAGDIRTAVEPEGGPSAHGSPRRAVLPFGWKPLAAGAGLLALAASALLLIDTRESPLAPLVSIVGPQRLVEVRTTGGFQYGPLRSELRGSSSGESHYPRLLAEVGRLRNRAEATNAPEDVHAWGVAQVIAGNAREGAATLESLRRSSPGVAAYESDAGAARAMLFFQEGRTEDAERALSALDRATALDPALAEAWFNKALVLQRLGRLDDAVEAWDRYLALDPRSPWGDEARRQRDALRGSKSGG